MIEIYTDGACSGNRRNSSSARAGVGVYFGADHELNYSAPLRVGPHTNQRAELEALLVAMELIEVHALGAAVIWSDSQYSIDCVTKWCVAWERNGWINSKHEPVQNQDLIKPLLAALRRHPEVQLKKVKGHSGVAGNEAADRLAVAAVQAGAPVPLVI